MVFDSIPVPDIPLSELRGYLGSLFPREEIEILNHGNEYRLSLPRYLSSRERSHILDRIRQDSHAFSQADFESRIHENDRSRSVDTDTMSEHPTIFSAVGTEHTATTASPRIESVATSEAAVPRALATVLSQDQELASFYSQAVTKLTRPHFIFHHSALLHGFLNDLRKENKNTRTPYHHTIRFLQSQAQQEATSLDIWDTFSDSQRNSLPQERKLGLLDHGGVKEHSGGSSNDNKGRPAYTSYQFESLLPIVNDCPSLKIFKSSIRALLSPPTTIGEALSFKNARVLHHFLEDHFDEVVDSRFPWLRELRDMGLCEEEIADILLEHTTDAPWIFFTQQDVKVTVTDVQKHINNCVHRFAGKEYAPAVAPLIDDQLGTERLVQELCGLAGLTPASRDQKDWNGSVDFQGTEHDEVLEVSVSYSLCEETGSASDHILLVRTIRALGRLCLALGHVQMAGLCCNSFTMLHRPPGSSLANSVVAMSRIEFATVKLLLESLRGMGSLSETRPDAAASPLAQVLSDLLLPFLGPGAILRLKSNQLVHYSALVTQTLCLAFLSYSQGHAGVLQPFFLDTPLRKITLSGAGPAVADCHGAIVAQFSNLSCVGDMLNSPVLHFTWIAPGTLHQDHVVDPSTRYDVLACAEDMIDTWGPGKLIAAENGPRILAIHLGGGIISASATAEENDDSLFHWSPYGSFQNNDTMLREFHPCEPIRVATAVIVNSKCFKNEDEWWKRSCGSFHNLGAHLSYWTLAERQVGLQGGNNLIFQANVSWRKIPGHTLKQQKLDLDDERLVLFLEDPFGVQVSLCTGVSRRVTLRSMLADLLPVFASSAIDPSKHADWAALVGTYKIVDFLRREPGSVKDWLVALPVDSLRRYAIKLIRDVLTVLQHTGVDPKQRHLVIAWPHKTDLDRCFRVPCQGKSSWLAFLADSRDCATFAYITTRCLETIDVGCSGTETPWGNVVPALETAVLRFTAGGAGLSSTLPQGDILEDRKLYCFEKMDGMLYFEAERPLPTESTKLVLCSSISPSKIQARVKERLRIRNEERRWLRERRALEQQFAEAVVVCSRS